MKKQKSLLKNKTKLFTENILGIILGCFVSYFIIPSAIEDIGFYFFKKKTNAEIVNVSTGGTSEKPYVVKVNYVDEYKITDFILVDSVYAKKLIKGGNEEIFFVKSLKRNIYFVDYQFPRLGSVIVGFVCSVILIFLIYSCTKNLLRIQ